MEEEKEEESGSKCSNFSEWPIATSLSGTNRRKRMISTVKGVVQGQNSQEVVWYFEGLLKVLRECLCLISMLYATLCESIL